MVTFQLESATFLFIHDEKRGRRLDDAPPDLTCCRSCHLEGTFCMDRHDMNDSMSIPHRMARKIDCYTRNAPFVSAWSPATATAALSSVTVPCDHVTRFFVAHAGCSHCRRLVRPLTEDEPLSVWCRIQ